MSSEIRQFRISIRRNLGMEVKPEAEEVDGKVFTFRYGWLQDEGDTYPGETAWMPYDDSYPRIAPIWISSGDLVDIANKDSS